MRSEIICVGTELILGDQINTNAAYLSKKMAELGIDVFYHTAVGDNVLRLQEIIKTSISRSDLIIFTGGLGPTEDDLTKQVLCSVINTPLYEDKTEVVKLKDFFRVRGVEMSVNNLRQAQIPLGAEILENAIGTASGILVKKNDKIFILLPGPPSEMKHVFKKNVIPWIKAKVNYKDRGIYSHTLKFMGISEGKLEEKLVDLFQCQKNPTLALLAKNGEIQCRITAKVKDKKELLKFINPIKTEIMERVGKYCFGFDDDKLEEIVGSYLINRNLTLATAESCTGGLVAKRLTDISGSSKYFKGSIIAYHNNIKTNLLKVPTEILETYGAVSEETALMMAQGALKLFNTDLAIAITGVAGPSGGTKEKPVGLVFIALVGKDISVCKKLHLSGNREDIRWRSSNQSLNILKRSIELL